MTKLHLKPLCLAIACALPNAVIAQSTPNTTSDEIETITVSPKGLISYISASASKSDTPIVKTPVSVSVLTAKRIQDIGAESLQDAIGYVAGVYNGPYGVDTRGDWSKIRGVDPLQYVDGLQLMFGHYNNARPNPYMLDRVEILKGPSSMLYGQGSTGGIINSVTKRPKQGTFGEVWAQLGNYDRKQIAADFNTALDNEQDLLFRVNGMWRDSGTQTEYVDDNTQYIAPSLTWHASDATSITLLTNFQKNESGSSTQFFPHEGTIKPAKYGQIPSERFVSEPGWDKYDTEQTAVTLIIDHQFNDTFSATWSTRHTDSESSYNTMYAWPPVLQDDKRSIIRNFSMSEATATALTSDLQMKAFLNTGIFEHNIVMGVDYQNVDTDTDRLYLTPATIKSLTGLDINTSLDLYQPEYGQIGFLPDTSMIPDTPGNNDTQLGFYLQDSIAFNHFVINAAIRHDQVESQNDAPGSVKNDQSATTGRLGVLYSFDNGLAPYISYSESFLPIYGERPDGLDENGNQRFAAYKPKQGEQVEVGLKYQPAGTEHLITAAYFDITDKNQTRQVSPNLTVQDGEIDINGFELEGQFEFKQLDIYAAYAYTDSENKSSKTPGLAGAQLSAMPEHLLSAWATYRPEQLLPGLKLGLGMRYVGETSDGSTNVYLGDQAIYSALRTDSYHVIDLMIGYEFNNIDLSLNVDNVADDTIITSCLARGDCFYGQRRTVTANVKYRF